MKDRLETEVTIDKETNEIHLSLKSACDAGWKLALINVKEMAEAFENAEGERVPYKLGPCCKAKMAAGLVASILELTVRDQLESCPGARRELAVAALAKLVSDAHKVLLRQHPEAPKPVGVA